MYVTFYKNCTIQPNHYIDNISSYLSRHLSFKRELTTSKDFISDRESFTIKIEVSETFVQQQEPGTWNYCMVSTVDEGGIEKEQYRYYFITEVKNVSQFIYEFTLSLDVVNSYQSDINNTSLFKEVTVQRRHKDRWKFDSVNQRYLRVFDKVDEGFGNVTNTIETQRDINSSDYYLVVQEMPTVEGSFYNYSNTLLSKVYCNNDDGDTTYSINKNCWYKNLSTYVTTTPTSYFYYGDKPLWFNVNGKIWIADLILMVCNKLSATIPNYNIDVYCFKKTAAGQFVCESEDKGVYYSSTDYSVYLESLGKFKWSQCKFLRPTVTQSYSLSDLIDSNKGSSWTEKVSTTVPTLDTISTVDSSLKAIINIPADIEESNLVWFNAGVCSIFNQTISNTYGVSLDGNIIQKANWQGGQITNRMIDYESKLYGSYVRDHYIAYDTFKLPIQPEYLNQLDTLGVDVTIPNDMTTNVMIQATTMQDTGYNANVLMCSRNNNLSIFTSDYLDYLRNGYNYDQKNKVMSNVTNWVNAGLSIAGTGVSLGTNLKKDNNGNGNGVANLAALNVISSGVSAATSLGNAIVSSVQNEQSLANKRNQILNSSVNMSGSDNVLLFKQLMGWNVIQYVVEAPNKDLLENIYNLFYFTGYADNLFYDTMPEIKTRRYFNFMQANINRCNISNNKERNRIVNAYASGITFEWQYNNTWLSYGTLYENWETLLS